MGQSVRSTPLIIINFKSYLLQYDSNVDRLIERIQRFEPEEQERLILCPAASDLRQLRAMTRATRIQLFAQTLASEPGTDRLTVPNLKTLDLDGALLNHPEAPLSLTELRSILAKPELRAVCVIVQSLEELDRLLADSIVSHRLRSQLIAFEPRELIGGKICAIEKDPAEVVRFVQKVHQIDALALLGGGIVTIAQGIMARGSGIDGWLISSMLLSSEGITNLEELVQQQ